MGLFSGTKSGKPDKQSAGRFVRATMTFTIQTNDSLQQVENYSPQELVAATEAGAVFMEGIKGEQVFDSVDKLPDKDMREYYGG